MKKLLLSICFIGLSYVSAIAQTYEYKVITSVESIVPNGLGRSRLISSDEERNFEDYTSGRSEENDERNKSKRSEIRVKNFEETKLLNFFNIGGIRFQNIVANDAVITSKLNDMAKKGWELAFSNSGVESYGGKGDSNGIFITRYIFKREVSKEPESAMESVEK